MFDALARPWWWGALLGALLPAFAWSVDSGLHLPPPAPVVDEFGLLGESERAQLTGLLQNAERNSGVEISIFIPSSLRDRAIEDFSLAVVDEWKLGRKKEDKGLLLTIAPKERKMRFEVGRGLEGDLTDAFTGRVLDNTMRPLFREGRYFEGIVAALGQLQGKVPLGLEEGAANGYVPSRPVKIRFSWIVLFLLFWFIGIPVLRMLAGFSGGRSYRRGRWGGGGYYGGWGGGSGGGGFGGGSSWGGGGGGFGGGGSSSSW